MTEKRLNEAMQSNLPEAPKGFDERIDQMALDLAAGQAKGAKGTRRLRAGLILAQAAVMLLGTFTAFAATNDRVNTWLYEFWPEAATALMPAKTSLEDPQPCSKRIGLPVPTSVYSIFSPSTVMFTGHRFAFDSVYSIIITNRRVKKKTFFEKISNFKNCMKTIRKREEFHSKRRI